MAENLSENDGNLLLLLARQSILNTFENKNDRFERLKSQVKSQASKIVLKEKRGTFVTLHEKGQLRGCIGNIDPVKTIFNGIIDNARHAAFKDSRFKPLSERELDAVRIEVSILTHPEKIEYASVQDLLSQLKPDIHGVIIGKGISSATFLPQVWQQLETPESFLSHLCSKAGLPSEEWKSGSLSIRVYQVQVFEESL